MIPVIVLVSATLAARLVGIAGVEPLDGWQMSLRVGLASMLLLTASAHWGKRRPDLVAMVPTRFPCAGLLVTVTGVLELAGAVGLLVTPMASYAAAGLALLFVAMFPANVSAAKRHLAIDGRPVTPLKLRTGLQLLFLAAAVGAAI
jgi:uncharacterized membrane protein